jgi:hypothetical protein
MQKLSSVPEHFLRGRYTTDRPNAHLREHKRRKYSTDDTISRSAGETYFNATFTFIIYATLTPNVQSEDETTVRHNLNISTGMRKSHVQAVLLKSCRK